jgi:hypothetical protein
MGKASRSKQRLTSREKIALQREAQHRAETRNRLLLAIGSVVVVVAIVLVFAFVKLGAKGAAATAGPTGAALATVISDVTGVPASTLAAVGGGPTSGNGRVAAPTALANQPALTQNGKPLMVYVGAEYCPYCAAERWAMAVALSRFGTFSNLGTTHSDPGDVFPSTRTLTFYKSSYTSQYLVFSPAEQLDVNKKPLQALTAQQQTLLAKYDAPPYVASSSQGAIPFIDIGNKYLVSGASYSPQVLQGKSWAQIAAALSNPSSPIAKSVNGAANMLTAAICKVTNNLPANVCAAAPISALTGKL